MKTLPYIGIIILLIIVLLQNKSCEAPIEDHTSQIDTVIVYHTIRDTVIVEKPILVASKPDTIWLEKPENAPDTTYEGLLYQYQRLGNQHFTTNVFQTEFEIFDYGFITITDSIYGNWLMNTTMITNLDIPETIITIKEPLPARNEVYAGTTFTGNSTYPISGIYGGLLLKTKRDRIYGANIGWTGQTTYGFSMYWKIKLTK